MKQVILRKIRLGKGNYSRWPAYEIERDKFGHWLFSPKGTIYHSYLANGEVVEWEVGRGPDAKEGSSELLFIPNDEWFVVNISKKGNATNLYMDICKPPKLNGIEWSFADLDLDISCHEGKLPSILDEDEFEESVASGQITNGEGKSARRALERAFDLVSRKNPPYPYACGGYFEKGLSLQLSSITTFPEEK